jgi:hypothetical protein
MHSALHERSDGKYKEYLTEEAQIPLQFDPEAASEVDASFVATSRSWDTRCRSTLACEPARDTGMRASRVVGRVVGRVARTS